MAKQFTMGDHTLTEGQRVIIGGNVCEITSIIDAGWNAWIYFGRPIPDADPSGLVNYDAARDAAGYTRVEVVSPLTLEATCNRN